MFAAFALGALALFVRVWLHDHPEHNPWAPLNIADPVGWATQRKLAALRDDPAECRAFLDRAAIAYRSLEPIGEGACRRADRTVLINDAETGLALRPANPQATCPVNAALALWMRHAVQPAAQERLGARVVALDQLGTANCRRIGGGEEGQWSEHATGNAIDIGGFFLADGRRIAVLGDWDDDSDASAFLHDVRDGACETFTTVLSPDYNSAHADHLHLDQADRTGGWSACR
ncbi:extensin [Novosphingobium sp. PC22D]|nr:extensin [Novosphingobium sp. PC22D]